MVTSTVTPTAVSSHPTPYPLAGDSEQLLRRRAALAPAVSGTSAASTFGVRVRRAIDVRALRLRVFLLVAVLLLPLVLITTCADR
ncbi:hypothetical protein AB0H57_21785 [Micromonospora sp. NPDC050686]|uniref:hypothetical protein n=1 Tax=Micromonospora sp. NPDC050686 TaxID=3154631 RepID=UPI003405D592